MKDKVFIDTNLLIYASDSNNMEKRTKAISFLAELKLRAVPIISTQTLGEVFNVLTRKSRCEKVVASSICEQLSTMFPVVSISEDSVFHAMKISDETQHSYWDSLILSVAIDSGCTTVFSEDLSDGQVVEGVRIVNPLR